MKTNHFKTRNCPKLQNKLKIVYPRETTEPHEDWGERSLGWFNMELSGVAAKTGEH